MPSPLERDVIGEPSPGAHNAGIIGVAPRLPIRVIFVRGFLPAWRVPGCLSDAGPVAARERNKASSERRATQFTRHVFSQRRTIRILGKSAHRAAWHVGVAGIPAGSFFRMYGPPVHSGSRSKPTLWVATRRRAASPIERTRRASTSPRQASSGVPGPWPAATSRRQNASPAALPWAVIPAALQVSVPISAARIACSVGVGRIDLAAFCLHKTNVCRAPPRQAGFVFVIMTPPLPPPEQGPYLGGRDHAWLAELLLRPERAAAAANRSRPASYRRREREPRSADAL